MGLIKEFKEFAVKGNAMDLAVGVIIGAAFGKIVGSLVEDVLMPVLGKVTGGLDFSNLYFSLSDKVDEKNAELAKVAAQKAAAAAANVASTQPINLLGILDTSSRLPLLEAKKYGAVLAYGNFITLSINFLIVAFCVFLLIKVLNTLNRKPASAAPATPPPPPAEQVLLTEIRDILKSK